MGCHVSSAPPPQSTLRVESSTGCASPFWSHALLTEKQKEIIYNTWRHLSDNYVSNGLRIFKYIFLRRPEVRELFARHQVDDVDLEDNPYFRSHAMQFMQSIGVAVDNLDDLERLTPMLMSLGEQHSKTSGFGVEYFEVFTQCLMLVWEERLGNMFTPKVRAAWEKMFIFILMTLREGYMQGADSGSEGVVEEGEGEGDTSSDTEKRDLNSSLGQL